MTAGATLPVIFTLCFSAQGQEVFSCADKNGNRRIQSVSCDKSREDVDQHYNSNFQKKYKSDQQQKVTAQSRSTSNYQAPKESAVPIAYKCTVGSGDVFYRLDACPARFTAPATSNQGSTVNVSFAVTQTISNIKEACQHHQQIQERTMQLAGALPPRMAALAMQRDEFAVSQFCR